MIRPLAAAVAALVALPAVPALAQSGAPLSGVILSERERQRIERVRTEDGRVVGRLWAPGIPVLYGFGDATGDPSSIPLVEGRTPSVKRSTPSGGIVPGQEPE